MLREKKLFRLKKEVEQTGFKVRMGPSNICEVTDGKRRTPGRTEAFGGRSVCTRLPRPDSRRRPPGPSSGVSGGASLLHWHVGLGSAPVQVVVRDSSPANY